MLRFFTQALLGALGVLLLAGPAGADKIEKIKSRGYMIAGITAKTPPFSVMHNDQAQGFEVDITARLARKLGVDIKYKIPGKDEADPLSMLRQGTVDIVAAQIRHTFSHDETVDFSQSYFFGGHKLLVKTASSFQTPQDLKERSIGFVANEAVQGTVKNVLPGCPIQNFATLEGALTGLTEESIAALAVEAIPFLIKTRQHSYIGDFRFLEPFLLKVPLGIALPENESNFRDVINQTLAEMWINEQYQTIYAKWFGPGSPFPYPLSWEIQTYPF